MPITGGIKFFDESRFVYGDSGVSVVASSGDGISSWLIDRNPVTLWRSVSSTDLTTETITITFPQASFDRLLFRNINWKEFTVQYDVAGIWTHFASVVGLDASKATLAETAFADDTGYYEFTEVTTTSIRIQVLKTQVANAQKFCAQILGFSELGTLDGWPDISPWALSRNQRSKKMLSGKKLVTKSEKSFEVKIGFEKYPNSYSDDLDLMFTLFDREQPFHIWLCGGRRGATWVKYEAEGFRLQDIYLVQIDSNITPGYHKNIYTSMVGLGSITFSETGGNSENDGGDVPTAPSVGNRLTLTNSMAATAFVVADKLDYRQINVTYHGYRVTLAQSGTLVLLCNPAGTWVLIGPTVGDDGTDLGLTFTITQALGVVTLKVATDGSDGAGELVYDLEYFDAP